MVKKLSKYSYSALDTYKTCPQKFKFEYVEKLKKEKKGNAPALMGNIVHSALEKLYKYGADGILFPLDDLKKYYRGEWNSIDIERIAVESTVYTIDDYIRIGEELLCSYYEKFQPFNQAILLGNELNLSFTLPGTDYECKCRIDRLSKLDDGTIEIVDYKTGTYLAKADDPRFYYQMGLYQLAVQANYPDFKEIKVTQYFLRHEEAVTRIFSEDDLERLSLEFKDAIEETLYAQEMNSFVPKESPLCNFCDYYDICPAKIHASLLEHETEVEGELSPEKIKEIANSYITKNQEKKIISEELESLKAQLIHASKSYNLTVFEGDESKVKLSLSTDKKFITKTEDEKKFNDLSFICRTSGLEEYFKLDANALMKEGFLKSRLPEDVMKKIQDYIEIKESARFTVGKKK